MREILKPHTTPVSGFPREQQTDQIDNQTHANAPLSSSSNSSTVGARAIYVSETDSGAQFEFPCALVQLNGQCGTRVGGLSRGKQRVLSRYGPG